MNLQTKEFFLGVDGTHPPLGRDAYRTCFMLQELLKYEFDAVSVKSPFEKSSNMYWMYIITPDTPTGNFHTVASSSWSKFKRQFDKFISHRVSVDGPTVDALEMKCEIAGIEVPEIT